MPHRVPCIVSVMFSSLFAFQAGAEVPALLGYQGRLLRADGTAATGTATVNFAMYGAATGGSPLWQEAQTLGLSDGYYSTFLGLVTPPDGLFDGTARWLEVRVGSETLTPRQEVASVAYAMTAQSVRGGAADVASLKVAGQTVVDPAGRLAGAARYTAGPGIAVDASAQTVSLQPCADGQALVRADGSWQCATAGTLTGVTVSAPLTVTGTATPQIALPRAGASSSGYLASSEWTLFADKYEASTACGGDLTGTLSAPVVAKLQSRAVAATAPTAGQVLKWNGAQWEPAADQNSGGTVTFVSAVPPLTSWTGSTTPQLSIAAANASTDGYLASADWTRFDAKFEASTQCAGDLTGPLSAPTVAGLRGKPVSTTAPAETQVLRFDGADWAPATLVVADVDGLGAGFVDVVGPQSIDGEKNFTTAPTFGGALGTASGGTGTSETFSQGAVVFAGADGSFSQDSRLAWDASSGSLGVGSLGVGTSSPGEALEVHGNVKLSTDAAPEGVRALTQTGWGYDPVGYRVTMLGASGGSESVAIGYDPSGNTNSAFAGDGREILFRRGAQFATPNADDTAWNNLNLVLLDGNVGIGTATPGSRLEVNGGVSIGSKFAGDLGGFHMNVNNWSGTAKHVLSATPDGNQTVDGHILYSWDDPARTGKIHLGHDGYDGVGRVLTVVSDGNVGVGTQSPAYRLDVNGSANASGLCIATDCRTAWNQVGGFWSESAGGIHNSTGASVGIGTTSPQSGNRLTVEGSTATRDTSAAADVGYGMIDQNRTWKMGVNLGNSVGAGKFSIGDLTAGANDRLVIDTSGNVGIGTANPGGMGSGAPGPYLNVMSKSTAGAAEAYVGGAGTAANTTMGVWGFATSGASSSVKRLGWMGGELEADSATDVSGRLTFWTNNAGALGERMRITRNGNVGIGTTSPAFNLVVAGSTANANIDVVDSGDSYNRRAQMGHNDTNGGSLILWDDSNNMKVDLSSYGPSYFNGGSVGIGTSAPAAKLDVVSSVISADAQLGSFAAPGSTAGTGYVTIGGGFVGWDYANGGLGINSHGAGGPVGGLFVKKIDSGHSNVGIGQTAPANRLSLGLNQFEGIDLGDESQPSSRRHRILARFSSITPDDNALMFYVNGTTAGDSTEKMRVNSSGYVGIGTTTPGAKLDVAGTARAGRFQGQNSLVLNSYQTVNPTSNVFLESQGNDRDSWIFRDVADPSSNWGIYHRNIDSTLQPTGEAPLEPNSLAFVGNGNHLQAFIGLQTGNAYFNGAGIGIDRGWANYPSITVFRHRSDGGDNAPGGEFRIHGIGDFVGGDWSVVVRSDGGYVSGSDARRKTNIDTIDHALDKVLALRGTRFNTLTSAGIVEKNPNSLAADGARLGFIAQEVAGVVPEVVNYYRDEDHPNERGWASAYSVDYPAIAPLMVEAIKELSGKVDDGSARAARALSAMERRLADLEARLAAGERRQAALERENALLRSKGGRGAR